MKPKFRIKWTAILGYSGKQAILLLMALITIYPIYYIFVNAIKSRIAYADDPLGLPIQPVLYNFIQVLTTPNFLRWFMNSLLLTSVSVFCCLFISALASYALSKMHFPGRRFLSNSFIALMVVPTIIMIIPLFVLMAKLHMVNKYSSAILIYIGMFLPFSMYLFQSFFAAIPRALIDSALIDGCGSFGIFSRIIFPLAKPIVLSMFVVCSLFVWNELLIALIFLQRHELRTLMVGLALFQGRFSINTPLIMAGMALATAPMLLLYVFCQRFLVRGLVAGSVKG